MKPGKKGQRKDARLARSRQRTTVTMIYIKTAVKIYHESRYVFKGWFYVFKISVALQRETSRLLRARTQGAHYMEEESPPEDHAPSTYWGGGELI